MPKKSKTYVDRTMIRTDIAIEILTERPMSSKNVGRGISNVVRIPTRPIAKVIFGFHPSFLIFVQLTEYLKSWPGRSATN